MKRKYIIAAVIVVGTMLLSSFSFYAFQIVYTPNILVDKEDRFFAIHKGTTFKELQNKLYEEGIVQDLVAFSFLAKLKDYDQMIKPGMYLLKKDMSNNEAINLLRAGLQTPVRLTFSSARKLDELPGRLTDGLEMDSSELATLILSPRVAESYGFDTLNFMSMFIPNTYEVYWTITPSQLMEKMKEEYDRFWNETRLRKADSIGLTPHEVAVLASIVQGETNKMDEAPTIAGVYMNRLQRGIPLQADPTVVYALGDFSIRRVLNKDKLVDSPYNTYLYKGLPPGPIRLPSIAGMNAVLNYEDHDYIYFCAKDDFSGYHVFAKTYRMHLVNARRFQKALNNERIFR